MYNRWKKSTSISNNNLSLFEPKKLKKELITNEKTTANKLRGNKQLLIEKMFKDINSLSLSRNQLIENLKKTELEKSNFNSNISENTKKDFIVQNNNNDYNEESDYKEFFFNAKVDHFSYDNPYTFKLRYLVKDKYFNYNKTNVAPILFYCGNEGPIGDFWNNSGFVTEYLAKKFNALVIFGEHRFFGKSFPNGSFQDKNITKNKYLTSAQALSDFVELLNFYKQSQNLTENTPVIAFGGSYGGMLSSWARMKFPNVFAGAVASSAPILLFEDITKISNSFFKITTETYKRYDEACPKDLRSGFQKLADLRRSSAMALNPSVLATLNEIFMPCAKIQSAFDIQKLEESLEDMLVTLAQYNYPYETSFIKKTPPEPVKVACERVSQVRNNTQFFRLMPVIANSINFAFSKYNQVDYDTKYKLMFLKVAVDVFFNYTGIQKCMDIGNDNKTIGNETESNGWSYMACTEMIMPMEKNGVTDMFNPQKWDLDAYAQECRKEWTGDIRPRWIYDFYGGRDFYSEINQYSNILYINGKMDPWNAGTPKYSNNTSVIVFEADSAHHLDLRFPHEKDPESILQARKLMEVLIAKWIVKNK
jgi:lysosomal Pro-X carboxypeptidase